MKHTRFNPLWKDDPRFKIWITEDGSSPFCVRCKFCQKKIDLSNMGEKALTQDSLHPLPRPGFCGKRFLHQQ